MEIILMGFKIGLGVCLGLVAAALILTGAVIIALIILLVVLVKIQNRWYNRKVMDFARSTRRQILIEQLDHNKDRRKVR